MHVRIKYTSSLHGANAYTRRDRSPVGVTHSLLYIIGWIYLKANQYTVHYTVLFFISLPLPFLRHDRSLQVARMMMRVSAASARDERGGHLDDLLIFCEHFWLRAIFGGSRLTAGRWTASLWIVPFEMYGEALRIRRRAFDWRVWILLLLKTLAAHQKFDAAWLHGLSNRDMYNVNILSI